MIFGKIINGNLITSKYIKENGITIINPTDEQYREYGYKPIIEEPFIQEEDKIAKRVLAETDNEIIVSWVMEEPPIEEQEDPTVEGPDSYFD